MLLGAKQSGVGARRGASEAWRNLRAGACDEGRTERDEEKKRNTEATQDRTKLSF